MCLRPPLKISPSTVAAPSHGAAPAWEQAPSNATCAGMSCVWQNVPFLSSLFLRRDTFRGHMDQPPSRALVSSCGLKRPFHHTPHVSEGCRDA
ncbi:hypothetical protein C8Q79DRAFT_277949 [Trametes meyenii]|nr:hypothetical protein C8Q79DRAFT_277949 [Trametes meyenii]